MREWKSIRRNVFFSKKKPLSGKYPMLLHYLGHTVMLSGILGRLCNILCFLFIFATPHGKEIVMVYYINSSNKKVNVHIYHLIASHKHNFYLLLLIPLVGLQERSKVLMCVFSCHGFCSVFPPWDFLF